MLKKKINLEKLVDCVGGKMTLDQLSEEVRNLYQHRNPEYTIITIERDDTIKGMRCTLYIKPEDFKKYR